MRETGSALYMDTKIMGFGIVGVGEKWWDKFLGA